MSAYICPYCHKEWPDETAEVLLADAQFCKACVDEYLKPLDRIAACDKAIKRLGLKMTDAYLRYYEEKETE